MNVFSATSPTPGRAVASSPNRHRGVQLDDGADSFAPSTEQESSRNSLLSTLRQRGAREGVKQALMGGLLTLDDTQVRDRPGRGSSNVDSSKSRDGYRSTIQLHLPWKREEWTVPALKQVKNLPGEWSTEVHLHALALGSDKALVSIPDSNAFVPAAAACSLFQISEDRLPSKDAVVTEMQRQALDNVRLYRHPEGGYNFYPPNPDGAGVKPLNLPVDALQSSLVRRIATKLGMVPKAWMDAVFDGQRNPTGADAVTNIPNDADDTGLAVAAQELERRESWGVGDAASLRRLVDFRDLGRGAPTDPLESWQGADTGAFGTWLTAETENPFDRPEQGVIPTGRNDVGPVVNSNALFGLALTDQLDLPGASAAIHLLTRTIKERRWQEGTRYYPQPQVFPYCATRAWRDGKINDPELSAAMPILLKDLMEMQKADGSFPAGKEDDSGALSTAMSVVALANIGRELAEENGLSDAFDQALERGVDYLVEAGKPREVQYDDTFHRNGPEISQPRFGTTWEPGVFFSGTPFGANWRSEGYTVAVVVEALAKYLSATDLGGERKLHPTSYATSAELAETDFRYTVS